MKHTLNPSAINCLIFDYGGTLDTNARHWAHVIWEGYQHAAKSLPFGASLSEISHEQFRAAYVYGERALAKAPIVLPTDNFRDVMLKKVEQELHFLLEEGIWKANDEERKQAIRSIAEYCYNYAARTVSESRSVLAQLRKHYRMILVSNFYGNIQSILHDFNLEFFEEVIESAVVGVRKPDPAIYQLGVDAAKISAGECLVVGDSFDKDIVPAKAVGCQAIWLKGEGWTSEEQNDLSLPDAVIFKLEELLALLQKESG